LKKQKLHHLIPYLYYDGDDVLKYEMKEIVSHYLVIYDDGGGDGGVYVYVFQ
jgi:hypothetical protein